MPIANGEQIYNTYGNVPNSDLLRRYGYIIPGSKDDIVEIPVELILDIIGKHNADEAHRRIVLLEEEDEDLYQE